MPEEAALRAWVWAACCQVRVAFGVDRLFVLSPHPDALLKNGGSETEGCGEVTQLPGAATVQACGTSPAPSRRTQWWPRSRVGPTEAQGHPACCWLCPGYGRCRPDCTSEMPRFPCAVHGEWGFELAPGRLAFAQPAQGSHRLKHSEAETGAPLLRTWGPGLPVWVWRSSKPGRCPSHSKTLMEAQMEFKVSATGGHDRF